MNSLNNCPDCQEYEKKVSKAIADENGLIFELINKSGVKISKWKIDNCVLKTEDGSKCDYLIIIEEKSVCYWIELKDEGLDDACFQICSTIKKIKESRNYETHYARIVLGRFKEQKNRIDNLLYTNHKNLVNTIGRHNIKYKTKIITDTI